MIRSPELRRLLEREGNRAREEFESLSSSHRGGETGRKREELREHYEEVDTLLGRHLPHERIISNQKRQQLVSLIVALVLLLFAVFWGIFALTTKARLHVIDGNIQRLVERFKEQGLRPE